MGLKRLGANDECLSVGIVGAGEIVFRVHLPVLQAMKDVHVAWITDVDWRKARSMAQAYKLNSCPLPDDLTNLPPADIVLLAIPYGAREPYYSVLHERSVALYVEKPFARTVEHHQKLCASFPAWRLGCGFQRRSWGPVRLLTKLIRESLFGSLRLIRYGWGGPGSIVTGGKYHSDIGLAGGGVLFECGIHGIDTLLFCSGAVAAQISSARMIVDGEFDLHTDATLVLTTECGKQIDCQVTVSCLQETINRLELVFDHAIVLLSFSAESIQVQSLNGSSSYKLLPYTNSKLYPLTVAQTFYEHWRQFLWGVRSGEANYTSASQAILTTQVIEGLYRAVPASALARGR